MSYLPQSNPPNPETKNLLGGRMPSAQAAHTPPAPQVISVPRYERVRVVIGDSSKPYTNNSGRYMVLIGAQDFVITFAANTAIFRVRDTDAVIIDAISIEQITAAGAVNAGLPRPMLVPPGGTIELGNGGTGLSTNGQAIICATLDDASQWMR